MLDVVDDGGVMRVNSSGMKSLVGRVISGDVPEDVSLFQVGALDYSP